MDNILAYFKPVKHFVFDIDGVLTDGSLIVDPVGNLLRTMNIKDGYALQLAIKKGYSVSIISGANNELVKNRLLGLGISDIHLKIPDKLPKLHEMIERGSLIASQILYMGDDMPDLEIMKNVTFPTCPADACDDIKAISKYISPYAGGKGAARDVIEKVLKLNNDWE
jgi:3-deoxy-D-manno-octulosonate 8-phosphate phosphatase (KDO 8-P phosphatase)